MDQPNYERREISRPLCLILFKPSGMLIQDEIVDLVSQNANILIDQTIHTTEEKVIAHYSSCKYEKNGEETYFYPALVRYMSNRNSRVLVIEPKTQMAPDEFVKYVKEELVGNNEHGIPSFAHPGQIRYLGFTHQFQHDQHVDMSDVADSLPNTWQSHPRRETIIDNLIHSSTNAEEAIEEIKLWLGEDVFRTLIDSNTNNISDENQEL